MTDREQASHKSINLRRIAFFAAAIALGAGMLGKAWLREAEPTTSLPAEPMPSPALDIGNAENRRALLLLQGGDGEWLGRRCDPTVTDSFRVTYVRMSSHDAEVHTAHVVGGSIARIKYSGDPLPDGDSVTASVDAAALARLHRLLKSAGYPGALPPTAESGRVCGEIAMVDSCVGGHYYGVVRECPDDKVFPLVDRVLKLAREQVEKTQ